MAGGERRECWVSRPAVRLWGFLIALASLVISVSMAALYGASPLALIGAGSSFVAVSMAIARPYVSRDGAS
jgi:fatty acid desaturase